MIRAISWLFLLYFILLMIERTQSIIRVMTSKNKFFQNGFSGYVNTLTLVSIIGTVILLAGFNKGFWISLFLSTTDVSSNLLCITAGVLLLSGMVHMDYTIPGLQFGAYGALIVGLILRTIVSAQLDYSVFRLWYSLFYLIVYSMAIPVMYQSSIKKAVFFHILEAITAFVLVIIFTFMMMAVMNGQAENLLLWFPFLLMIIPDAVLIAMRWKESKNIFVLIFAALSALLFILGKILFLFIK